MSTHQQLLYHLVFSTKGRKRLLSDAIRDDVFAYMAGICKNLEGNALDIGKYIRNQMEHHCELTFEEEYVEFLKKHEVEFDERYVFD